MDNLTSVLIGNARVITLGENNKYVENGAVFASNGVIREIGETEKLRKKYSEADYHNMKGMVLMPGNIIAHTHLYSSFARGMGLKDEPPANFVEILERLWWRLDKVLTMEDIYFSSMSYLLQCIRYGTTTIIDHHASPGAVTGSLDTVARAVFESGLRASLCYEVTDRNGLDEAKEGIKENIRFVEKCRDYPTSFVKAGFGIHASFTVGDETLARCIEAAREFDTPLHIHVEEALSDRLDSEEKYGMPVLARLEKMGALKVPVLACHCVHLAEEEFEILKNRNIVVIHNPSSNMNNAVGVAQIPRMLEQGAVVGLGTDGMTADFFQEMKILPLLHKVNTGDPRTYSFPQLYQTIFLNNPRIAGLFWKEHGLGSLEVGNYADMIALEYDPPTPLNADNTLGHILFGMNSAMVNTTIANGQVLMKEREILHLDQEKIMNECRKLAGQMWKRF
ncbi:MAG: putative aminohydrolase SsnA [Vulcanimicrobiota bacterium]